MEQNTNKKDKKNVCPICGREFHGYGNDPHPLNYKGQVCDECNAYVVIPTRYTMLKYMSKISK